MSTTTSTTERILRVSEVAKVFDVNAATIYRLIQTGHLRSIRVGRLIRVPASAIDEFIAGGPAEHPEALAASGQ